ncbi:MAG: glycosyltransferase, partial [Pirellulales bacterium]
MAHRILHIIPSLDRAGAEKQLVLLASHLPRDAFDVHVCALTRGGPREAELVEQGIPVEVIGKRWKVDPLTAWRLGAHIRHIAPDLVQTWLFVANAYGRAAARWVGVPHLVAGERCVDPWKTLIQLAIDRRLAQHTARIVVNSPGVREFYVGKGIPPDKFTVIPGGVARPQPSSLSRSELLTSLRIEPDVQLIGVVGRLWPQKRVKDLIWAADLCHLVRDKVRLLIIGDGPQRRQLERFTMLIKSEKYVRFLGERSDVQQILPHLDVVWLGSGYEGLPNSVMEAMAAGVPVVATDIPGCRDLVVPGETGFLVPIGDRAGRARATIDILEDPQLAGRMGDAARERVLRE